MLGSTLAVQYWHASGRVSKCGTNLNSARGLGPFLLNYFSGTNMETNEYNRLGGCILQDWYTVRIMNDGIAKRVEFDSRIHKNMPVLLPVRFAAEFSDRQILNDATVVSKFRSVFGYDTCTGD